MAREDVIKQARWRYRECVQLAQQLRYVPEDPVVVDLTERFPDSYRFPTRPPAAREAHRWRIAARC